MHRWLRIGSAALAALVFVAPASAIVFAIHLHNGATFETRFEPQDAEYDEGKVVFVDEVGVLIALSKADIDRIESDVQVSGFGHVIDDTTIAVGWAPNDAPEAGSVEDQARQAALGAGEADPAAGQTGGAYNSDNLPPTMQIIPTTSASGDTAYVVPAAPPAAATPPPGE